ncbi:multiple epidermal growth factor-like domains protein 11 [Rhinolophus ferrumequinum]|uniref:multiple epidermal growth factor-like domains protein 11 n=1 Tax=Rhinolophus ferrumequinum TaxID=59479 RepID=UPI00140FE13B|nr:multiple epidermal growth factor-like domains protein 11 [Rhinolophus ferrumequinum]
MPQPGLWMVLAPLLAAFNARTAILSPCSGAHCHLLCLVICLLGQHCMTGSCLQCPAGFYRLGGRSALQLCPTGACDALPGLSDSKDSQQYLPGQEPSSQHAGCVFCPLRYFTDGGLGVQPCPTGHFCADDAARSSKGKRETPHPNTSFCWAVLSHCLQCPAGHFCPSRATHPIPCQPGTFNPRPGQDEAADCVPCPAGRACTQAGLTQPDTKCTLGYMCPVGSSSPHAHTHTCPAGTFSRHHSLSSLLQCKTCPAGLACPPGTGGPNWPPTPCPAGHYCPPGTKQPTQFQCPPGTWSNRTRLTTGEECAPCPRGWFCVSGAQVPSGACRAGHYCPQGTKWGTQFPCPAGTYSSQAGNGQMEDCLPCPPGAFCPSGAPKPVLCPRGTSRQSPGARLAVACVLCPSGHHCPELGTATPRPCGAGSFSGPGRLWCQECPGGKLCNQTKLAGPTACPPGHYCPAQGLLSIPCPMVRSILAPSRVFTFAQESSGGMGPVLVGGMGDISSL